MFAYIKIGKKTQKHGEYLQKLGYELKEENGHFKIEVSEFHGPVDLSTAENREDAQVAFAKEMRAKKAVISYKTPVTTHDGKAMTGLAACAYLGVASCLVAKESESKQQRSVDAFFAALSV